MSITGCGGIGIELRRMRIGPFTHVARKLDDRTLHTEADAEEGNVVFACIFDRSQLTRYASISETGRHEHTGYLAQHVGDIFIGQVVRKHVCDVHLHTVSDAGKYEAFGYRFIGILVLDVLTDKRYAYGFEWLF